MNSTDRPRADTYRPMYRLIQNGERDAARTLSASLLAYLDSGQDPQRFVDERLATVASGTKPEAYRLAYADYIAQWRSLVLSDLDANPTVPTSTQEG